MVHGQGKTRPSGLQKGARRPKNGTPQPSFMQGETVGGSGMAMDSVSLLANSKALDNQKPSASLPTGAPIRMWFLGRCPKPACPLQVCIKCA